jgi:hypothetical protein
MEGQAGANRNTSIATLNDLCRITLGRVHGRVVVTQGIAALTPAAQLAVLDKVKRFDAFSPANDPYGERDFGAFEHDGERIFWKIDDYDPQLEHGSEDPADPARTQRVLTVMLASEY